MYYVQFTFLEILFYFCTEMYQITKKKTKPNLYIILSLSSLNFSWYLQIVKRFHRFDKTVFELPTFILLNKFSDLKDIN